MNFDKYIGKYIVLVTNFVPLPDKIFGIRNSTLGIELFKYKGQFVCVRVLLADDLRDEDFVQWLAAMWPNEDKLITFLQTIKVYNEEQSSLHRSNKYTSIPKFNPSPG
jgi:hypothetical protein